VRAAALVATRVIIPSTLYSGDVGASLQTYAERVISRL
jgi:hypothetical protein